MDEGVARFDESVGEYDEKLVERDYKKHCFPHQVFRKQMHELVSQKIGCLIPRMGIGEGSKIKDIPEYRSQEHNLPVLVYRSGDTPGKQDMFREVKEKQKKKDDVRVAETNDEGHVEFAAAQDHSAVYDDKDEKTDNTQEKRSGFGEKIHQRLTRREPFTMFLNIGKDEE